MRLAIAVLLLSASPLQVTTSKLFSAYAENEIGADAKYKGKTIEVTGPVFAVGKAVDGSFYVALSDRPNWIAHCMLETNDPAVGELKTGQKIKVIGEGTGLKRSEDFNVLRLAHCKL